MSARQAFEHLAQRGTPRGADVVLRAARTTATVPDPVPRRWPLRVVLVGVAAVFLIVLAITWRVGTEDSQPVDTGPGYLFGEPTNTTLIINTGFGSLVALDLDTGVAQQYDDLDVRPIDTFSQPVHLIADRIVYQGGVGPTTMPMDLEGQPHLIAEARRFVASGQPGRIWLVPGDDSVTEVTLDGRVTVPRTPLPAGRSGQPVFVGAGVGSVLAIDNSPNEFWDPRTGRQFGNVEAEAQAARGSTLVAGWPSAVVHLPDGRTAEITPDFLAPTAAISPDEQLVAVWKEGGRAEQGDGPDPGFVLIDAVTGAWRSIPVHGGAEVTGLAWSPDGSWVFALGPGSISAYRIDAGSAMTVESQSLVGGGMVGIAEDEGPPLLDSNPSLCPEASASPPSPDATYLTGATDGGQPVPDIEVDNPITVGEPCQVRLAGSA